MKLEERQSALENEMNTAKDTIWRLTNRIFNLENEVVKLKQVFRLANGRSISTNSVSTSKIASAKLAEIARRRQKSGYKHIDRRPTEQTATLTSFSNSNEELAVDNVEVKQEPISDAELEQNDVENVKPHSSYNFSDSFLSRSSSSSHNMSTRGLKLDLKIDDLGSDSSGSGSSDYGSDDDYVTPGFSALRRKSTSSGNRLSVGRPIGSVWKHFKRVALKTEDGTAVMRAICKYCKQAVSPRSDRLKPHIQKCLANDRKESISTIRTAKYTPRKIEKKVNVVANPDDVIKMDTSSIAYGSSDEETEENITSPSYNLNRSLMRGRKKGPIWAYFDETWITMTNGEKRRIAVCKKCRKHLDKKTDRLRSHLKKCLPDAPLNDIGGPSPLILPSSIQTLIPIHETSINIPTKAESAPLTAPESTTSLTSVIVTDGGVKPIDTTLPTSEVETNKGETGEESDLENMFRLSNAMSDGVVSYAEAGGSSCMLGEMQVEGRRNPVWEHFRIVTVVGSESSNEGPSHIAVCNKCNEEVHPKTCRLQNHLNMCTTANTNT